MTRTIELLPALDASYLDLERPGFPMHFGMVAVLEGGPLRDQHGRIRLGAVRGLIDARLDLVPRFRQLPVPAPAHPGRRMWVDDSAFDIADHVLVGPMPRGPDEADLLEVTCELHQQLLDRSRSLWELWLIDGLPDGRIAMIEKVHHSMVDGVGGVDVAMLMMDAEPIPLTVPGPHEWHAAPAPGIADGLAHVMGGGSRVVRGVLDTVQRLSRADPTSARRGIGRWLLLASELSHLAPASSLNQPIGTRRHMAVVRRPLEEVKEISHALRAKVNDVVLAAVAGGLRELLVSRGEHVSDLELRALVPVSLRSEDEHGATLGNRTGALFVELPVFEPDVGARVEWIARRTSALKVSGVAATAERALSGADVLPPFADRVIASLVHHQPFVNLVITNVPGVQHPLYIGGARLLDIVPVVPLAGNLSLGVAILSHDGTIDIGINADVDTVPDLAVMRDGIDLAFDDLRVGA